MKYYIQIAILSVLWVVSGCSNVKVERYLICTNTDAENNTTQTIYYGGFDSLRIAESQGQCTPRFFTYSTDPEELLKMFDRNYTANLSNTGLARGTTSAGFSSNMAALGEPMDNTTLQGLVMAKVAFMGLNANPSDSTNIASFWKVVSEINRTSFDARNLQTIALSGGGTKTIFNNTESVSMDLDATLGFRDLQISLARNEYVDLTISGQVYTGSFLDFQKFVKDSNSVENRENLSAISELYQGYFPDPKQYDSNTLAQVIKMDYMAGQRVGWRNHYGNLFGGIEEKRIAYPDTSLDTLKLSPVNNYGSTILLATKEKPSPNTDIMEFLKNGLKDGSIQKMPIHKGDRVKYTDLGLLINEEVWVPKNKANPEEWYFVIAINDKVMLTDKFEVKACTDPNAEERKKCLDADRLFAKFYNDILPKVPLNFWYYDNAGTFAISATKQRL